VPDVRDTIRESRQSLRGGGTYPRPLRAPHDELDTSYNIFRLCPNHHILLDQGGVGIGEDLSLIVLRDGSRSIGNIESTKTICAIAARSNHASLVQPANFPRR